MMLRLHQCRNRQHVTIITISSRTLVGNDEKKLFYDTLREVLKAFFKGDKVVLLGDFNARLGKDIELLKEIWN